MGISATIVKMGKPRLQGLQEVLLEPKSGPSNSTFCLAGSPGRILSLRPQYPCVKGESMISDILPLSRVPREVPKECDIFLPSLQIMSS